MEINQSVFFELYGVYAVFFALLWTGSHVLRFLR